MPFTQQQTNNSHTNQLQETSNSCSSRSWRTPRKGDSCGKSSSSPWSSGAAPSGTARSRFFSQDRRRPFSRGDSFDREVNPPGFRGRSAAREQELRAARAKASREMAEEQERRREARKQREAAMNRRREAAEAVKAADQRVQELKSKANMANQSLSNLTVATQRAEARRAEEIEEALQAADNFCQKTKAKGTLQARVMEKKRLKRLAVEEEKARKAGTLDQLLASRATAEAEKAEALLRPQRLRAYDEEARQAERTALDEAKHALEEAKAALAEAVGTRAAAQLSLEECATAAAPTPAQSTTTTTTQRRSSSALGSLGTAAKQVYRPPVAAQQHRQQQQQLQQQQQQQQQQPKSNFFQSKHPPSLPPGLATAPRVRRNFDVRADGPVFRNATQDEEGRWWLRSKGKVRELRQDPVDPKKDWYTLEQVKKYYRSRRKWSLEKTLSYWEKEMAPKKPKKAAAPESTGGPVRQLKIINGKPKLVVVEEASLAAPPLLPNPHQQRWRKGAGPASMARTYRYHSPDVRALPLKPRAPAPPAAAAAGTKPTPLASEKLGSWRRAGA